MTNPDRRPSSCFEYFEQNRYAARISDRRFRNLLENEAVEVHEAKVDTNHYGEFLFITLSCRDDEPKTYYTFFSLGYHEARERWISGSWGWYQSQTRRELPTLTKDELQRILTEREAYLQSNATDDPQSERALLFEMLAEIGDEDGALSDIEDFESLGWILFNDERDEDDED